MYMNVLVYGVHHWPDRPPTKEEKDHCNEWYHRIMAFVPGVKKVFVSTGTYSNPIHSPLPENVHLVQNNIHLTESYSRANNYFRNGFMTGIWHSLINEKNWDVLFHVQTRVLLGESLEEEMKKFFADDEMNIMAPRFTQQIGCSVEISITAMKPLAARKFATSGVRQSLNIYDAPDVNCEEEAYIMFNDTWFNPWQSVITTRMSDHIRKDKRSLPGPFMIYNESVLRSLPFISTNRTHITDDALNAWKEVHPCPVF